MGQDGMGLVVQPNIASVLGSFCVASVGVSCHIRGTNNRTTAVHKMCNDPKTYVPRR